MIFQNCCPKHPIKAFLVPNLRILIFAKMLDKNIRHIRGHWFKIWQWIFRQWIPAWKYPNKRFFVPNVSTFYFCTKLCILKNSRVLISKIAIMFFKQFFFCFQKIHKYEFFLKPQRFPFFKWNFLWTSFYLVDLIKLELDVIKLN